ncbi:ABC transporter permease [Labrys wisconsinensis]|uniref:Autoinducer 2 import system permease protein LsrD n=1 Tax=Labrys wisconsinensis TaxID=425677 RepID=A0ABU0J3M0_9HYPH|nr:ABC transporter permease [Labrys wisconsinensis]MDQ0467894.1 ribose transport system permease protein [Labrys wisconsinensis]
MMSARKADLAPAPTPERPAAPPAALEAAVDGRQTARWRPESLTVVCVFGLSILLILLSRFVSPALGSWSQVNTVLVLSSFLMVVAFGQGLVILVGGLDLSVPALITIGGVLTTGWIGASGEGSWYLIPAILAACAGIGAVSGLGVALLAIPPFIMTMATGIVVASAALGFTSGTPRGAAPPVLVGLMKADWLGMPLILVFILAFCVLASAVQSRTSFGRRLMAIGANPVAARVAGLAVRRSLVAAYMASAASAGFAGMMLVGYANGATLRMGNDYLLPGIAAVVIGGSSILGGSGSFLATIGGAVLLTTLGTVIAALGVPQGWRTVIEGSIILVALLLLRENVFAFLRRRTTR